MNQRILMIGEHIDVDECEGVYTILGSTGKQYRVRVSSEERTCTCPDHSMRLVDCKHILFVLIQVLGFDRDTIHSIKKHTLKEALVKRETLLTKHAETNTTHAETKNSEKKEDIRKQTEGADCPICLEPLETGEKIVYCKKTCGNNFHDYCFSKWKRANNNDATCPMCRGQWK